MGPLRLAPLRRQEGQGHAGTAIRIVRSTQAEATAPLLTSSRPALKAAVSADPPRLAPLRRHATTVIRIVSIIWAIVVTIASNGFVPEAAAPAGEVRKIMPRHGSALRALCKQGLLQRFSHQAGLHPKLRPLPMTRATL